MLLPNQRQGMYIAVTDSRSPTSIHRLQKLFPSNNASPKNKRTQGRIFDWTHPEWSYAVMQTCLVKRLRTNMDQLYIRESLSNIEQLDD